MLKFGNLFEKKLDPVGQADADIDNDGDVDSSDKYLHNRRKAVKKAIQKDKIAKGRKMKEDDGMTKCPECDGSTENHDPECSKYQSAEKRKMNKEAKDLENGNVDKALKHDCASHVTSEQWGFGECIPGQHTLVENAEGEGIVTHYDVMFEHGVEFNVPIEELKVIKSAHHMHKKAKKEETQDEGAVKKANKMKKNAMDAARGARHKIDNPVGDKDPEHKTGQQHNKAIGRALRREDVNEGYESVQEVEQEVETTYSNFVSATRAALQQMWEEADRKKHTKGATPPETMKDKLKGKGAEDMASVADNPEVNDDDEKGHDDASKAGRVTKKAPARNGDNPKGDTKIVNPVKGAQ